ncbi:MAG: hypothetical protein Q8R92_12400 [Deltaproteobacteria bacterium]|nr:hypothetical protein [Deltaproteobacteria bacterium]
MSITLSCTRCDGPLAPAKDCFSCNRCGHALPVRRGVVWASGEAPASPPALAQDALERGWLAAAETKLEAGTPDLRVLMMRMGAMRTERAGDWQFLVEPDPDGAALVLGDPWGAHLTAVARTMGSVAAFVQDAERAEYLRVRADQESLDNVHAIVHGRSESDIPFTRDQFSLVSLMGAWRGAPGTNGGGGDPLGRLISTAFRLLHKGGTLVLGMPNRIRNPLGARCAGGRALASTLPAFRARLARSGFHDPQLYLPVPDLSDLQAVVSLDSKEALRYFHVVYRHPRARWKRALLGAAIDAGLVPVAAPSYIAVARKS